MLFNCERLEETLTRYANKAASLPYDKSEFFKDKLKVEYRRREIELFSLENLTVQLKKELSDLRDYMEANDCEQIE